MGLMGEFENRRKTQDSSATFTLIRNEEKKIIIILS